VNINHKYYMPFVRAAARPRGTKRSIECGTKRGRNSLKTLDRAGKNAAATAAPFPKAIQLSSQLSLWSAGAQRTGDRVKGLRIDPVLLFQDARRKGAGVVRPENRHARLG
jgi:hypothetical protein